MSDFYIEHPEELKGQPKRTIGDYVERNGILVPQRFDSLADAFASGKEFIARSEHPQEYDGMSGMLMSHKSSWLEEGIKTEEELKAKGLGLPDIQRTGIWMQYIALGVSEEQFKQQVSYSCWEFHEGVNCSVVADSAIPKRYHIMSNGFQLPVGLWYNYTCVDGNTVVLEGGSKQPEDIRNELPKLLKLYESVRQLPRFDPAHCPIMEMQKVDGKIYFLQYHRTRDFMPADFVLDRPPKPTENRALFVRGVTPPDGCTYKITAVHGWIWGVGEEETDFRIPEQEEGALWRDEEGKRFPEIMARKRRVQVINHNLKDILGSLVRNHFARSILFKPELTIVTEGLLYTSEEYKNWVEKAIKTGEDQHIDVHVVSDGRTAYVERV